MTVNCMEMKWFIHDDNLTHMTTCTLPPFTIALLYTTVAPHKGR
jgi:hypothetical protein